MESVQYLCSRLCIVGQLDDNLPPVLDSGMQLVQCVSVSVRSLKELAISANAVLARVSKHIYEALAHVVQYSL